MTTAHTPAPWKAQCGIEDDETRWIVVADGGAKPWLLATVENGQPGDCLETEKATAHLIAAAPDLLAVLTIVRDADNDCRSDGLPTIPDIVRARIDAAIAKAEGGAA